MLLILATVLACRAALATDLVMFQDGRGLRVRELVIADGVARLTLEDGGTLGVPASTITAIERAVDPGDVAPTGAEPDAAAAQGEVAGLRIDDAFRKATGPYADLIAAAADRNGLERALLAAVAKVESNFDPYAVSPRGACGMLQLMPATAKRFGVTNVFDVAQNVEGGARYLRWLLDHFGGRVDLALAGYNAGEGAVERSGGIPPFSETRAYVFKVLDRRTRTAR